jgi:hypothetical protein
MRYLRSHFQSPKDHSPKDSVIPANAGNPIRGITHP